jgi:hypothetical protein
MSIRSVLSGLLLLCAATPALAQTAQTPAPQPIAPFALLDRQSGASSAGLAVDVGIWDGGKSARAAAFGEWTSSQGLGAYVSVPVFGLYSDSEYVDDHTGLGNVEVGTELRADDALLFRVGVVLPTADDDVEGIAVATHLGDYFTAFRDLTTVRFSVSPMLRRDRFLLRLDVGLDVPVNDSDQGEGQELPDPIVRINVGAAASLAPQIWGALEISTIGTTGDTGGGDRFITEAGLSLHAAIGQAQPYVALIVPLSDELDGLDLGVSAGVNAKF